MRHESRDLQSALVPHNDITFQGGHKFITLRYR